ncbi:MAG: hypothetical protein ACR2OC_00065 [Solirubrobacterales bacterium]
MNDPGELSIEEQGARGHGFERFARIGEASVKFNTALALALLGISILLTAPKAARSRRKVVLGGSLATLAGAIGAVSLAEQVFVTLPSGGSG